LIDAGGYIPDDGVIRERKTIEPPTHRLAVMPDKGGSSEGKGERRAIEAGPREEEEMVISIDALVRRDTDSSEGALVRRAPALNAPDISQTQLTIPNALPEETTANTDVDANTLHEIPLDPASHLARALAHAGLPETAIVTRQGTLVPQREVASGAGDGLGRGDADRKEREELERRVMGEERDERGTLVPTWGYKVGPTTSFSARRRVLTPFFSVGTQRAHVRPGRRCEPSVTGSATGTDGGSAAYGSTRDSTCEYTTCGR
jgi:protein DGCR14